MEELTWATFWINFHDMLPEYWQAWQETLIMLGIGLAAAVVFGGPLGIILYLADRGKLFSDGLFELWGLRLRLSVGQAQRANRFVGQTLGWIVNMVRSFPVIILIIVLGQATRFLVGTTIGPLAIALPLSLAAIPYFARLVEQTLRDIPRGVIEAAEAMGASPMQIIVKVLLNEGRSGLISSFTILTISFLGYTAMAGLVGGGGIGDLAVRYGYYRYQKDVMYTMVVLLVIMVQVIQISGNYLARKLDKR